MRGTIRRGMNGKATLESQLKLYKTMAVPTAGHGSETKFVRKNQATRIQTAEMKFLRRVAEYTRTNHQRNPEITKVLKVFSLNIRIQNYGNNWLLLL